MTCFLHNLHYLYQTESSGLLNNLSQDEIFESFYGQESPDLFPSQSSQPYDNFTPIGM